MYEALLMLQCAVALEFDIEKFGQPDLLIREYAS